MLHALVRTILRLLYKVEVRGSMKPAERLLIVSNHQSFLDGLLLGAFLPLMPVWFVHTVQARKWYWRPVLHFVPHEVVDTTKPWAMKTAIGLIESGWPVLIFPEGRITQTGSIMKIYDGPAFVAVKTGAIVIPVHIDGAAYSPFGRVRGEFPRKPFPRITITIDPPQSIAMPEGRTSKVRRRKAGETLRRMMQAATVDARDDTTLFSAFLDAVSFHGRRRRILDDTRQKEQSYHALLKSSLALGRLVAKSSREGEYIGVLMPNAGATVALLFGIIANRRVPAILNFTSGAAGIQSACRMAKVRTVFTSRAFLEQARLGPTVGAVEDVQFVCLEDLRPEFKLRDKLWLAGWALWFPRRATLLARPEDPAAVLFTSGSEGKPKGVVLSHRSILANMAQIKAVIEFAPKDKFLSALPLFHAFGLTIGAFLPLLNGSRVVLYPSPLHYRVIPEMIYDRDCTVLFATNTFLAHYGRLAHPFDFHYLRIVVSGAERLTEDVRALYNEKFGIRILEGYGATECSPVLTANTPMGCKFGTVGEFLPRVEHRIEPVRGLEDGGLLHVRGPNVMLGYLREEHPGVIEPPSSAFGQGWYNTGDVVSVDESGYVRLLGRMRRFAKVAGEMVSLELVEKIAAAASPEHEHASTSLPEPGRGEMILLFTADPNLRRERLQQQARELRAPELAVPRRIVPVEGFPLLGNGKKDYVALNRMAQDLVTRSAGSNS